jgi:hypothetical protein
MQVRTNLEQVWTDQGRSGGSMESVDLDKLRSEITHVRERGISRIDDATPRLVRLDLPGLRDLHAKCADVGSESFVSFVRRIIFEAIERIEDPADDEIARILFGFLDDFPRNHAVQKLASHKPTALRECAIQRYVTMKSLQMEVDKEDWRKGPELHIIDLIARYIRDSVAVSPAKAAISDGTKSKTLGFKSWKSFVEWYRGIGGYDRSPAYITRSQYEEQFSELIAHGERVVVFTGEPGIGKTWLASWLLSREQAKGASAVFIRMGNGNVHMPDLQAAYSELDIDPSRMLSQNPQDLLAHLICCREAPQFVLLDGLFSSDELAALPIAAARATIIATCRTEGSIPMRRAKTIRLIPMTLTESVGLIMSRLDSCPVDEAAELAVALQGYPLAMSYGCDLVKCGGSTMRALVDRIVEGPGQIIADAVGEDGKRLQVVINGFIKHLSNTNRPAYLLLDFIASCQYLPWIATSFLERWYARAQQSLHERFDGFEQVRTYASTVKLLADLNLIYLGEGVVSMHPLIREMVMHVVPNASLIGFHVRPTVAAVHDCVADADKLEEGQLELTVVCAIGVFSDFLIALKRSSDDPFLTETSELVLDYAERFCKSFQPKYQRLLSEYQATRNVPPIYRMNKLGVADELAYLFEPSPDSKLD